MLPYVNYIQDNEFARDLYGLKIALRHPRFACVKSSTLQYKIKCENKYFRHINQNLNRTANSYSVQLATAISLSPAKQGLVSHSYLSPQPAPLWDGKMLGKEIRHSQQKCRSTDLSIGSIIERGQRCHLWNLEN